MRLLQDGAELKQGTAPVGSRTALMYRLLSIFPSPEPCSGDAYHPQLLQCTYPDAKQWEQQLSLLQSLTISQMCTEILLEEATGTAGTRVDFPLL